MPDNQDGCNPACQKILLDFAMALVRARTYLRVIVRVPDLARSDYEAPLDFIESGEAFQRVALWLNRELHGSLSEFHGALMARVNEQCYRADKLKAWALAPSITPAMAKVWTTKLYEWSKEDQDFFTAMIQKVGEAEHVDVTGGAST